AGRARTTSRRCRSSVGRSRTKSRGSPARTTAPSSTSRPASARTCGATRTSHPLVPADPDHRVVTARVIGVPAPGTVVWRADGERTRDGAPVTGDLDDPDEVLRAGDGVVLEVVR